MEPWIAEAKRLVLYILGDPQNPVEIGMAVGFPILTLLGTMSFVWKGLKMPLYGWFAQVVAVALNLALMLAATVAAALLAAPQVQGGAARIGVLVGAPVLAILVIGIPLMLLILRTKKYLDALLAFVCGVAVAALVLLLVSGIWDGLRKGKDSSELIKKHNAKVAEEIEK